eukprot:TRINITY_DN750_c0_g2_i5.p1 TRINITY_DN750_c0_g2~~TRINITY_DN750_c0_g2_i5.p1  ORF type:complete len:589 (+),score=134.18 TRINITY_DN750_c0_g2_i5:453-2219(+)
MAKMNLPAEQEYEGSKLKLIGIYSKTKEEWLLTDIACWMMDVTNVPLYDTLGEETICWTFEQTLLSTIFLNSDGILKLASIMKKGGIKTLKNVVCFDEVTSEAKQIAGEVGLRVIKLSELVVLGKENSALPLKFCGPESMITICYTSGTTDRAKGVVLTHRNFRDNAHAVLYSNILEQHEFGSVHLSYLPLAHVFERIQHYICIVEGLRIAYFRGDMRKINEDILAARPDVFVGVPRVFGRFYDVIMKNINSLEGFKRSLVDTAIATKLENYRKHGTITHWLYDRFIFNKIRNTLGGRLKLFACGAAPMDDKMMTMFRIFFSAYFLLGYGQTESAGPLSISYGDDTNPGSSGPPMPCCIAKVVDVPEMRYLSTDTTDGEPTPRGELCFQGTQLAKEYFKNAEKTAQMYDDEGWYHTGDIAQLTSNGVIKIIDRKKNLFKLQQGEYIAPEKIENALSISPWVTQLFVYGDSYQSYLVGVLVPNKKNVEKWASDNGVEESYEEVCKNKELNATILKDLSRLGHEKKLVGFEIIKKLHITSEPFTVENGLLTPTLKVKRYQTQKAYQDVINELYAEPLGNDKSKSGGKKNS